jgi:hypothetical protein
MYVSWGCSDEVLNFFRVIFDGHLQTLEIELTPAFPGQVT